MKYNFDELIPRFGTNSCKWDNAEDKDILPLWVADMDFRTAPAIIEVLHKRIEHGIFGYTHVPDKYYEAVDKWFSKKHGLGISKEWVIYISGIVPALSAIVKALASPGEKVMIQTPVYNCFFSSIRNNGCEIVENSLVYEDRTYHIDFEDMERKAADPAVKLFILCNPHNPAGRVWTREELTRMGEICIKHNVFVIADEIHCELTLNGHGYTPFASISQEFLEHSVTCISPSKAFNIAGLQIANIVAPVSSIRRKIDRAININEVCDINPLGVDALIAAYGHGEEWLEELKSYLYSNYIYLKEYFKANMPKIQITELEGTYLVWADCRAFGLTSEEIAGRLKEEHKVWINPGTMYGADGEGFIRINIACPRKRLEEALLRFKSFYNKILG
ncbi:MAG: pyridoxal phosphate-dependent aminotransferase [Bacteroides sp.]|nr:pyridoxal phosphate-dependent aminotransferase [Bacteroides sp.]